jgi:hypothetical protein
MNITIETITPKIAEAWINANKSNRRLRDGVVERYADDMSNGRWTSCPEPISFYEDGDLADGQHRLFAIIESDTQQIFPVVRGLKRADGLNLNTGLGRTLVDNARISKSDDGLSRALISTARAMEFGTAVVGRSVSNGETLEIVNKHREAASFAASEVRRKSLLCGAVVMGAVGRAYAAGVDVDKLRRFCDVLGTGLYDGERETAAVAIRNYLLEKGAVLSSSGLWVDTFMKVQNAIRYFADGKKLTVIKAVSEEAYPLRKSAKQRKTSSGH